MGHREHIPVYAGDYKEILTVMRINELISTEFDHADKAFSGDGVISSRNEKAANRKLLQLVNRLLDAYTTSVADDKALSHDIGYSEQMRNAIIVRKGEKEVLQGLQHYLESKQELSPR